MNSFLSCGRFELDLSRPRIMAIVNVTPDSFSGDGHQGVGQALRAAEQAVGEGAELLDIGGESTRPGSQAVTAQEELDRVMPVVEALAQLGVPLSVDTVKPVVMAEALRYGADLINDIAGFRVPGAIEAVASSRAALCVMHMQGEPRTMQVAPSYANVTDDVAAFLESRVAELRGAGVDASRILLDPGFGFGKTVTHNLTLLVSLKRFLASGYPLLVGMSRKSMLGSITDRPVDGRLVAGSVAAFAAIEEGARIIRTHDVGASRDVIRMWLAIEEARLATRHN
ncbi:dihydropteroate synthase [Zoogloea sp.]|uniref:dihydropteroate synthase n=1 Tax=Zoogloea sp. TaxID=49181 RepID=UPI002615A8BC|nr:dihydropteroate synthase [Zoogloea sp.]MDD3354565.1 dihydropteroate synthase [Zoogloea sp.]